MIREKAVTSCFRIEGMGRLRTILPILLLAPALVFLSSCGEMNPQNTDIELEKSAPVEKVTNYTQALLDLGLMSEIYDTGVMRVQSQDIADETGTSITTGGEIQRNITEIMKSTLNSIGGNIVFIEYDPSYIQNQMVSGYSNFDNKLIPDVVITGGITEFDRGLETRGEGLNADAEADFTGSPDWFPSETAGISYGDTGKSGKARITLDFNLKDFQTLASIPRMTTTNSMEVYKGLREEELGITLFGPTFGLKGTIKKVQGRHEAVRVLVQVSMIQMIGKYLALPYWRMMGDDANPDRTVLDSIATTYYQMEKEDRISAVQQWLVLHGHSEIKINNKLDEKTKAALAKADPTYNGKDISEELFTKIYLTIPITRKALAQRTKINDYFVELMEAEEKEAAARAEAEVKAQAAAAARAAKAAEKQAAAAAQVAQQQAVPAQQAAPVQEVAVVQQQVEVQQVTVAPEPAKQAAKAAPKKRPKKFGRKLSDDDW